ncbi:zinc dependent phospholipase C family protein [Paenibacillus sanguinis]|uniref:zinc dependent phospholipase C family protein n=1 Tax=Paenibacillus sanguinis TaxID=225906 RepID=UPI00036A7FBB|nr:zinc dependent phospholipase C family protein [Paenibacillus sanguinis]
MPALWMHIEYGQQLAAEFRELLPFLSDLHLQRELYQLGCQGPDFLLFHGFLSWRKSSSMTLLGNLMHSQSCGPTLIEFWKRSLRYSEPERTLAQLYFLGFLTHHLLDRNFHPYINWKAGYERLNHQRFEIALDAYFLYRYKRVDVSREQGWKQIKLANGIPRPILQILQDTTLSLYPEVSRLSFQGWQQSYKDMVLAHRLLYDPSGWKRSLVPQALGQLLYPAASLLSTQNIPDYLNEQRKEWRHSALYSEVRRESVWELWEQALEDGRQVLHALAEWLHSSQEDPATLAVKLEDFQQVLGNRSYDTGKECSSHLVNLYAEPIWSRQRTS